MATEFEAFADKKNIGLSIERRIQDVSDGMNGRKTRKNLWGLFPSRRKDLMFWDNTFFGITNCKIAGTRVNAPHSDIAEKLLNMVIGKYDLEIIKEKSRVDGTTTIVYRASSGLEFHRHTLGITPALLKVHGDLGHYFPDPGEAERVILWEVVAGQKPSLVEKTT
jgi:hypothetical protein